MWLKLLNTTKQCKKKKDNCIADMPSVSSKGLHLPSFTENIKTEYLKHEHCLKWDVLVFADIWIWFFIFYEPVQVLLPLMGWDGKTYCTLLLFSTSKDLFFSIIKTEYCYISKRPNIISTFIVHGSSLSQFFPHAYQSSAGLFFWRIILLLKHWSKFRSG